MRLGFIGNVFNLVIPGAVGGDLIKAAFLVPDARQEDAGDRLDGDRPDPRPARPVLPGGDRRRDFRAWPDRGPQPDRGVWMAGLGFLGLTAIFTQALTRFPGPAGSGNARLELILRELNVMSTTYRGRLRGRRRSSPCVFGHSLFVLRSTWSAGCSSPMTTTLARVPDGPADALHHGRAAPFGALGLSEGVGQELFKLVGHPAGAGDDGLPRPDVWRRRRLRGVYLANLKEVRGLSASAHHIQVDPRRDPG